MRVIDALHAPWAIRPETLRAMVDVYERHAKGDALDLKGIEAAIGKPLNNEPQPYEVIEGVAVLNVVGVLGKRFDMFTAICGGASTQRLQQELAAALEDPTVHSILLNVDSPGGTVDGTQALASDVRAAREKKPVVALIDGMGASAAYWIASAAQRVYITGDTTAVGSIGVVIAHKDVSKAEEMRGVKTTEITAGKFKRIASNFAPLSPEGRQSLQDLVDHIYSVFVESVAANLGVSVDAVLKDMADGRLFLGEQAISAGLVHGISTMTALIELLNTDRTAALTGVSGATAPQGETTMFKEKVIVCGVECTEQDAVDAAVKDALAKATADGKALGLTDGAKAERERITAIQALALPGHDKLITDAIANGTPAADVAVSLVTAEKGKRAKVGADLITDAPNPVPETAAPDKPAAKDEPHPQVVSDKARAYVIEQGKAGKVISLTDAVAHVRREMGLK